jgi:hypothetical protein
MSWHNNTTLKNEKATFHWQYWPLLKHFCNTHNKGWFRIQRAHGAEIKEHMVGPVACPMDTSTPPVTDSTMNTTAARTMDSGPSELLWQTIKVSPPCSNVYNRKMSTNFFKYIDWTSCLWAGEKGMLHSSWGMAVAVHWKCQLRWVQRSVSYTDINYIKIPAESHIPITQKAVLLFP